MYYFTSMFINRQNEDVSSDGHWSNQFSDLFKHHDVNLTNKKHCVGDYIFYISFIIPRNREVTFDRDLKENISYYVVGDVSESSLKFIKNNIVAFYKNSFERLTEFSSLYNLILIDNKINKVFFFCDDYHAQTLYFSESQGATLISNNLKGIVSSDYITPELNIDEVFFTLQLGARLPENTLIKNVYRVVPGCYLNFPSLTQCKIPGGDVKRNAKLTSSECVDTIYDLSINALKSYENYDNIALLYSGGSDSTSIARLFQKTNCKVELYTYFSTLSDANIDNLMRAKKMFGLTFNVLHYDLKRLISSHEKAIWHGECEAVGTNSLNISLEMNIASEIGKRSTGWTLGDYYQSQLKQWLPLPTNRLDRYNMLFNYHILTEHEVEKIIIDGDMEVRKVLKRVFPYLFRVEDESMMQKFQLPIYPNALYRSRNRFSNFESENFFLNRDQSLLEFMKIIPLDLISGQLENINSKSLYDLIKIKVLGEFYEKDYKKAWMSPYISEDKDFKYRNKIAEYCLYDSAVLNNIFGKSLSNILSASNIVRYQNLLFFLWSLDIFYQQFVENRGKFIQSFI